MVESEFEANAPFRDVSVHFWTAARLALFNQADTDVIIGEEDWLFTAEEFRRASSEVDLETELSRTIEQLSALGITLIPVIVPDKARIYEDMLPHARLYEIELRYGRLKTLLADYGFPVIDLEVALRDGRTSAETFMRTDTHWSPAGAEVAAKAIAAELSDMHGDTAAFETTTLQAVLFEGDLARFLETGPFATWIGPQPEAIAVPETTSTGGADLLFGDPTIPIALVGTSFSAREDFNFAGFLSQHTGLDVINLATIGEGPFAPMRSYLASETLKSSPPSIVIWELPERYISVRETP
ncbi:alginate O-acetyltransferase AlgX-related protein [Flavimaricola marinus]|nr:hypothetical protein [Flavimaricola marinus]